jgi:hypothetical protein
MPESKPVLEFDVDFMTKRVMPIHLGRIALGNNRESAVARLVLLPDGLHIFVEDSKFLHIATYNADYYELSGFGPEEKK